MQPPQDRFPVDRTEAEAALGAYQELGPQYSQEVVDSFIDRVQQTLAQNPRQDLATNARQQKLAHKERDSKAGVMLAMMGLAIPLTAIAGGTAGPLGLFLAWAGIVALGFSLNMWGRNPK